MHHLLRLCATVALVSGLAPAARAQVPSPANSTVDPCLIVCPAGDIGFTVIVRDAANNRISNSLVLVDFCAGNVRRCDPLTVCQIGGETGPDGRIVLAFMAGGISATAVEVTADGVLLATRPIASPDQDGSLVVDGADVAIAQSKLGAADPTMDLDCDQGVVDEADLEVQAAHLGHSCDLSTPARPGSWGRLKILCR